MQQNSYGFRIDIQTQLDLSTATAVKVRLEREGGTVVEHNLAVPGDITNAATGEVSFLVQSGDLTVVGPLHVQVIDITPGRSIYSAVGLLIVEPNVPAP